MADEPPVHVITEDGKLRICLSQLAKWIGGMVATLLTAICAGAFVFAWQSNMALGQIMAKLEGVDERLNRYYHRLEKIEEKVDRKEDRK